MIRLVIVATLALAISLAWIYGAMRVAESIARTQQQQIQTIEGDQ